MRIVCLSDTHYTNHILEELEVPSGDVLIHAGDATFQGKPGETGAFMRWMNRQPHRVKLFIPGNHDFWFDVMSHESFPSDTVRVIVNGWYSCTLNQQLLTVFGMSYVKELPLWAFNSTEEQVKLFLERAVGEQAIDLLVTHMPPYGIMDYYREQHDSRDNTVHIPAGTNLGSKSILDFVKRKRPRLHVFGHIHEGHGLKVVGDTTFVNASILDDQYKVGFKPIVVDWMDDGTIVKVL